MIGDLPRSDVRHYADGNVLQAGGKQRYVAAVIDESPIGSSGAHGVARLLRDATGHRKHGSGRRVPRLSRGHRHAVKYCVASAIRQELRSLPHFLFIFAKLRERLHSPARAELRELNAGGSVSFGGKEHLNRPVI
ncbi:hypothetical protein SDC9_185893 [bioreactor metagenome]|uniref:Uncharacterized protein n=1 Tax=bioreactor metagenome TaxID=1076179 RepID=A0A645HJI9_9ZZZZ